TGASGVRVYYTDNDNVGSYYSNYNSVGRKTFAERLLEQLKQKTNFSKESDILFKSNLSVLRKQNFISALLEIGFINNPNDRELLLLEQTREDTAAGIYKGIVEYYD